MPEAMLIRLSAHMPFTAIAPVSLTLLPVRKRFTAIPPARIILPMVESHFARIPSGIPILLWVTQRCSSMLVATVIQQSALEPLNVRMPPATQQLELRHFFTTPLAPITRPLVQAHSPAQAAPTI